VKGALSRPCSHMVYRPGCADAFIVQSLVLFGHCSGKGITQRRECYPRRVSTRSKRESLHGVSSGTFQVLAGAHSWERTVGTDEWPFAAGNDVIEEIRREKETRRPPRRIRAAGFAGKGETREKKRE